MTLDEMIYRYAQKLPYALQKEALDFVQYLLVKVETQDNLDWSVFALSSAMRDMEDEPILYSMADVKVKFA